MSIKSNITLKALFFLLDVSLQAGAISYTLFTSEINTKKKKWQISGGSAASIENHGAY